MCSVDVEEALGDCSPSNKYGYENNHPCVFLKLNRIFKWTPEVYERSELPDDMPQDLKDYIINEVPTNEVNYFDLIALFN